MSRIVTLTTDFGNSDWYVGAMKGVLLRINPAVTIVDITHDVPPQDIIAGSFILLNFCDYYPENTIHVAIVDPGVGSDRRPIAVRLSNSQIFILPDNGLISLLMLRYQIIETYLISNPELMLENTSFTFHGRDIFAPVAAHLSNGASLASVGPNIYDAKISPIIKPVLAKDEMTGEIIYIDHYGNCVTNIRDELKYPVEEISIKNHKFSYINQTYSEVEIGSPLILFGSHQFLEIAVNQGNAQRLLGISKHDLITVKLLLD
ncbi:unnamed protein product [Blepharisma stoltei]|uniref:Uncharacterized protein n=1 Tax=Blepharisma stoltei TaxID=1481888 RepID=A0AAU9JH50_9CILI|nr:unnamed protein product [Blepharisma stoltei]